MLGKNYRKACQNLIVIAKDKTNLTNKELASDINISYKTLYYVMRGESKLNAESLLMLLDRGYITHRDIIYSLQD